MVHFYTSKVLVVLELITNSLPKLNETKGGVSLISTLSELLYYITLKAFTLGKLVKL